MTRKLWIKTYGCQMNVYDSQRIGDLMAHHGYTLTEQLHEADLVVLNTCHIREKAAEKVYSDLGRVRAAAKNPLIAVAGCVAQAEGEEIFKREAAVDIVVGPQSYHRLPELVAQAAGGRRAINTEFPADDKFDSLPAGEQQSSAAAFLSIQEGCDKFCTFCVVPYTRGAERSRPAASIVQEARDLVRRGARELTLLGQNVNAYHGEDENGHVLSLAELMFRLADIPDLQRLRYMTSHPRDMSDDLIAAHRALPQLMPYLHLPLQSGSDDVLRAMNRGHSFDDYRRIIEALRNARPDVALSSDFIVGFPGESDFDFKATLEAVREIGFASAFSFKYSRRPGTPAASARAQVSEPVKEARLAELQALLAEQQLAFNRGQIGRTLSVLAEKPGKLPGQVIGRSPYLQPVHFTPAVGEASSAIGNFFAVHIASASPVSLAGECRNIVEPA